MDAIKLVPFVYDRFSLFVLIFTRISALFTTFKFFSRTYFNSKILVSLSAILSFYVMLFYTTNDFHYQNANVMMIPQLIFQFFLGFLSGLILNLVFEVFMGVGQIVSLEIGLNMQSLIDPALGNVTTLTQFYSFAASLIFLSLNGHLFIIKTIVDSFEIIPLGKSFLPTTVMSDVLQYSVIVFSGSILLSMSIIVAIFLTNFTMAIMTKFAPQFNLFSIGVNMTLIIGLICVYLTFNLFVDRGVAYVQDNLQVMHDVFIKLKHYV